MRYPAHTKQLILLAYPVYFELLASVISGIVDVFWVSKLGDAAVAAVTIATSFEVLLLGVILTVATGATVLISTNLARNDLAMVKSTLRGSWILWGIIAPIIAFAGYMLRTQIALFFVGQGNIETVQLTAAFFAIAFPGILIFYAQNIADAIFKGDSNTQFPMRMSILTNALILALDPLLIYGLFGLPKLGVQGAAFATLVSRVIALGVSLYYLRRSHINKLCRKVTQPLTVLAAMGKTLQLGFPMAGDFLARSIANMILIGIIGAFGAASLAGYGIGLKLLIFVNMSFYAVRQAASIYTARLVGEQRSAEISHVGRQLLLLAGGIALTVAAFMAITAPLLVNLFITDSAVIHEGSLYLRYMSIYLLPFACMISIGGVFIGTGRGQRLLYVTLVGVFIQVPLAYWLSTLPALQVQGVWLAIVTGTSIQSITLLILFFTSRYKIDSAKA